LIAVCEQEHSYHYSPPGFDIDDTALALKAFEKLNERFTLMVVQMVGQFDSFVGQMNEKINHLKEHKKKDVTLRRTAAERSLTMATTAFGDGIEYVRESVETKAMNDQTTIMTASTEAREIIAYQLEQVKDNLWRQISYLAKKLYADDRGDYNNKIKQEILDKFKEFKVAIVGATKELHETQTEKWLTY
jgi:hypothetical protein